MQSSPATDGSCLTEHEHELLYRNRTRIVVEMAKDEPGALNKVTAVFDKYDVNMTHISSKLASFARQGPAFHIDFVGRSEDAKVASLLEHMRRECADVVLLRDRLVPWFPVNIRDLDYTRDTLDGGTDLINEDHPGFNDERYRERRNHLSHVAQTYRHGERIPTVDYNEDEIKTWGMVYEKLKGMHEKHACKEFLQCMAGLEKHAGYAVDNIPQLCDISDYLQQQTGFTLRPVQGLLSARDFLNALAFRVFFSTQYIRHHGNPFYTPEPDICHELIGHVPMFADPYFADFSQEIGLASLGASDEDIEKLATNYWFTVEFGLCREGDQVKAFGAGLLSSSGEIEWACADEPSRACRESGGLPVDTLRPEIRPYDPAAAAVQAFPITTYQPMFYCAESLEAAKRQVSQFCDSLQRPFFPVYEPLTSNIIPDRAVRRMPKNASDMLARQRAKQAEYFESKGEQQHSDAAS